MAAAIRARVTWILFSLAGLIATLIGAWQVRRAGLSLVQAAWTIGLAVGVGLVVGHWVHLAFHPARLLARPESLFLFHEGGFSSFGVYGGAVLGAWIASGREFWRYADRLAPGLLVGAAFARTACLWHGCDFGRISDAAWAWSHAPGSPAFRLHRAQGLIDPHAAASLPTHAFPLYEAVPVLLIGLLALAAPRIFGRATGQRAAGCAAAYCAARAVAEHWRGDIPPTFGITTMQLLCIAGLIIALIFLRGLAHETHQGVAGSHRRRTDHRPHGLSGLRG